MRARSRGSAAEAGSRERAALPQLREVHETLSTTGDLAYLSVLDRLTGGPVTPMPPPPCAVEPGVTISSADSDRLVDWLEAGAPDGATWEP